MIAALDILIHKVETLTSISKPERLELLQQLKIVKSEQARTNFKLNRLKKDKSIVINILETAINDIEFQKKELEKANQQLQLQQEELKQKNLLINEKSEKLKDNLNKLELSYNELEQFAYIASHDLKSPLRTISSFAQLLHQNYSQKLDEKADKYLDYIIAGVIRMNEVIESLLQYSMVGVISEKPTQVNLNDVLEQVKLNLADELKASQANIYLESLPSIFGMKVALVQLFQNLLHNAIKFRRSVPPCIIIKTQYLEAENCWEFSFTDNGIGIDKTYQEKIFQPFHQLSPNNNEGLGIGLSICRKAVKIHNGYIYFKSIPNEGTTFVFTLSDIKVEAHVDEATNL